MWISVGNVRATLQKYDELERAWLNGFLSFSDVQSRFSGQQNNLFDAVGNTFPAGLVPNVTKAALDEGFKVEVFDARSPPLARDPLADLGWLRDYQRDAVEAVLRDERGIVKAPTGCLAGSVMVTINRAGVGRAMRLDRVVAMVNGAGGGRAWRRDIPTMIRAPMQDGTVRLARVVSAKNSGIRPVYRVSFVPFGKGAIGRGVCAKSAAISLEATACHRFKTPHGWERLDALSPGDFVLVDGGIPSGKKSVKPWYKLRACRAHPFAGRRGVRPAKGGWTVPEHRLVAEARANNMPLEVFLSAVESHVPGLVFLDPDAWAVHHRDENPRNNAPENLEVLTHEEHRKLHAREGAPHLQSRLVPVAISKIEYVGEKETFDLEVDLAAAFIANGVAVHNSGKTEIIIGLTHAIPVRWLVMAPRAQLVEQLADRYQVRTPGMPVGRIGEGKWDVPADANVVVATFQSLYTDLVGGGKRALGLLAGAQALACDEAHTVAADTFWRVVMKADGARIRVGFSGTPLDRGDRRNVLVVAALGRVIYKIPFEVLAERGVLARPEITMVEVAHEEYEEPTWQGVYGKAIVRGAARNRVLVEAAKRIEKPALLFVKEVKHGRDLTKSLLKNGVKADFVWGSHSVDYRNSRIKDVVAGRLDVLVCSVVFQEGIDVPDLRGIIVGSGGKSVIAAIQRVGRGTRIVKGKTTFEVFDVADRGCGCSIATGHQSCRWLQHHAQRRERAYTREGYAVKRVAWAAGIPLPKPRASA